MDLKIIYEDNDVLVVDKPAGIVVFPEGKTTEKTLIDLLLEKYPKLREIGSPARYGIVHRLDKDTSGILLVAKTNEALIFFQKQFSVVASAIAKARADEKALPARRPIRQSLDGGGRDGVGGADKKNIQTLEKTIEKRYIALVIGNIKNNEGTIHTLIGRAPSDKRKQKAYLVGEPGSEGKREAITKYKVLERFEDPASPAGGYTLLEIKIETGRRHQIRCHLSYIHHPIAGDKMYGFKDSPTPEGLTRQFLHAAYLKIQLPLDSAQGKPIGETKEFHSDLPEDLKKIIKRLGGNKDIFQFG